MPYFLRDLRFGARLLAKDWGFALGAIAILAIGIGANTAIFTVASALLVRPFPYREPQQLVSIEVKDQGKDYEGTLARYELIRDRSQSLQSVAAWANDTLNLTGHGEPLQVAVGRVSANFFTLLGVEPQLGRTFTEDEGRPEGRPVVILSDAMWHSRFGADPGIVGQAVTLDGTPYTVVGVLPASVQFPFVGQMDVWTPRYFELTLIPAQRLRQGVGYLNLLARMRPETTLTRAQAELAVLNRQYREQNPNAPDAAASVSMIAEPLREAGGGKRAWEGAAAVSGSRACAADCMRECCQPLALARAGSEKGNCGSQRAGGDTRDDPAAAADGERSAVVDRRRARYRAELDCHARAGHMGSGPDPAGNPDRIGPARVAVYSRGFDRDRNRLWDLPCPPAFAHRNSPDVARGGSRQLGRTRARTRE